MNKNLLRITLASAAVALCLLPTPSGRGIAHAASGASVTGGDAGMSEEVRLARLEDLLDRLFDVLGRLYPQIDWEKIRTNDDADDNRDQDDDDDESADDSDDDSDDGEEDDDALDAEVRETNATAPVGGDEARANFEIPITLSAFSGDFYIPKTLQRSASASGSAGVTYKIEDGSGTTYPDGSTSAAFTSPSRSGDTSGYYKVNEGEKRAFMINITLDNEGATQGFYRAQLVGVAFDGDASAGGEDVLSTGFSKYETPTVFVDDTDDQN
jgi:hypothetical protein